MITKTISADHVTPVRAYAALRAQTPDRSSFLLEALGSHRWGRRYSVVGYRTRAESLYPGMSDVLPTIIADLEHAPSGAEVAAYFSKALVGYVTHDQVFRLLEIEPFPDEEDVGRMMREATVAVFDHVAHTVTVAGRTSNAVERCLWEMVHGPELLAFPVPTDDLPAHVNARLDDASYLLRAERALNAIREGQAERVTLGRTFLAPQRDADPFDVYRALRLVCPDSAGFFLEFAATTVSPWVVVLGTSSKTLFVNDESDPDRAFPKVAGSFLVDEVTGAPAQSAATLSRGLEVGSRGMWGGGVGFFRPDGVAHLIRSTKTVVLRRAQLYASTAAVLDQGTTAEVAVAETHRRVRPALRAIRAAHDAAVRRDEAKRAKAEAEAKEADKGAEGS